MDRKGFFTEGIKEIGKNLYNTPVGKYLDSKLQSIINALEPYAFFSINKENQNKTKIKNFFLRPPGAVADSDKFLQLCNSCGDCIIACPHHAIYRIPKIEGPLMDPNVRACYLCDDFPCISACERKALLPLEENTLPSFGIAKVNQYKCLNYTLKNTRKKKLKCTKCFDECPIASAVNLKQKIPAFTEFCVGCGICKKVCPTNAIEIEIY